MNKLKQYIYDVVNFEVGIITLYPEFKKRDSRTSYMSRPITRLPFNEAFKRPFILRVEYETIFEKAIGSKFLFCISTSYFFLSTTKDPFNGVRILTLLKHLFKKLSA